MNQNQIKCVGEFLVLPYAISQGKQLEIMTESKLSQVKKITLIALSSLLALVSCFTSLMIGSKLLSYKTNKDPKSEVPPQETQAAQTPFDPRSLRIKAPSRPPSPEEPTIAATEIHHVSRFGYNCQYKRFLTESQYRSLRMQANILDEASKVKGTTSQEETQLQRDIAKVFESIVNLNCLDHARIINLGMELIALSNRVQELDPALKSPIEEMNRYLKI